MTEKKNVSALSDHVLYKKRGMVITPFNDTLGDKLVLASWTKERMPEYLWLGLILIAYGRKEGLERAGRILLQISQRITELDSPRLSNIFNLPNADQEVVYKIISDNVDRKILSPLTTVFHYSTYPLFNNYFNDPQISFETRLTDLLNAVEIYFSSQSNEATDLRYLSLGLLLFRGKIKVFKDLEVLPKAIKEYPYIDHDDERMRLYRPSIRSMEISVPGEENHEFSEIFWKDIGMMTFCDPYGMRYEENEENYQKYINSFQKTLEYLLKLNRTKTLPDDKFDVFIGSITYSLKIFIEICEKDLGNRILGRHGVRTLVEILIMVKYLLKLEITNNKVWEEYKLYGVGKYKLVLLKARDPEWEKDFHFKPEILDTIVNEMKFEEFIDIELTYFDKKGIREKSEEVGEKYLHDFFYDYDSNFTHGFWGAIRESAMLHCNNPAHQYHSVPDIYMNQNLPDIKRDCLKIMKRFFALLKENYDIPESLMRDIED